MNLHPTFQYAQPEGYSFSHDSVFLARFVFEKMAQRKTLPQRVLDLCAGCGIIGMDYLFHLRQEGKELPRDCDFLEVQEVYETYFARNLRTLGTLSTKCSFVRENYECLQGPKFQNRYDLILCNPPYFRTGQGKLSPSEFKNRCRFFIDSDFAALLNGFANSLSSGGEAYLLLRDLADHGWDPFAEAQNMLGSFGRLERCGDIRGTDVVRFIAD